MISHISLTPHTCISSPTLIFPTLTNHPKSIVYLRGYLWCCTFYSFRQMYNNIYIIIVSYRVFSLPSQSERDSSGTLDPALRGLHSSEVGFQCFSKQIKPSQQRQGDLWIMDGGLFGSPCPLRPPISQQAGMAQCLIRPIVPHPPPPPPPPRHHYQRWSQNNSTITNMYL